MPRPRRPAPPAASGPAVTLRQVAEATGFSIATVSCAFNGKGKVSEVNRAKILDVAKAMGYRPNLLVKAMQSGVSGNIGVVIPPYGEFTRELVNGVSLALGAAGKMPIVHWARSAYTADPLVDVAGERDVLNQLLAHRVDGIILAPSYDEVLEYHFTEVWRRGLPLVSIDRTLPKVTCDSVSTDDVAGGRLAAEHLLALGHRRFVQVAGEQRYGSYRRRAESFAVTVAAAGGTCRTVEVANADVAAGLGTAARNVLAGPLPTAVFLGSDVFAPALYAAAQELGLGIPRDLAVVGYAGLACGRLLSPSLTTIQQDPLAIGARAAALILERLAAPEAERPPQSIVLTPHLVVRDSSGVPRG